MKAESNLNYLGLIDDMVLKYPWRFKVTEKRLFHSMAVQVIDGDPILLNDGYLVNHPICRKAISEKDNLVWRLLAAGFLKVYGRGGDQYSLAEMPEKMAHIASFDRLVSNREKGIEWADFRNRLEKLDGLLRENDSLVAWTKFDVSSGYLLLAERLLGKGASPRSLGLGWSVRSDSLRSFLQEYIDLLCGDMHGARNKWEALAIKYSEDRRYNVEDPLKFVGRMMGLANEMYHYNQGLLLSAHRNAPVSVETQMSAAFDDLLLIDDLQLKEVDDAPVLNVPYSVADVDAAKLVHFLDPDTEIGRARENWFHAKSVRREGGDVDLRDEAKEYSAKIKEFIGSSAKCPVGEGLIDMVIDLPVAQGAAVAGGLLGLEVGGAAGAVVGTLSGYCVSKMGSHFSGLVKKKYRITRLEMDLLDEGFLNRSKKIMSNLKKGRVPSSLVIDPQIAKSLAPQISVFG